MPPPCTPAAGERRPDSQSSLIRAFSSSFVPPTRDPPLSPRFLCFKEFVLLALSLRSSGRLEEYIALVVSGRGRDFSVRLNTTANAFHGDRHVIVRRRFGLVVGVSQKLLLRNTDLRLFMTPTQEVFREETHITHLWSGRDGFRCVPLQDVPQHPLGTYGDGSAIILLLPNLYRKPGRPNLSYRNYKLVKKYLIEPAIRSLTYSSIDATTIPSSFVPCLGDAIKTSSDQCEIQELRGIQFLHLGRESSPAHAPGLSAEKLEEHLRRNYIPIQSIPHTELYGGTWYTDVAAEVATEDSCLVWRSDRLSSLFRHVTGCDLNSATRYERHFTSHIVDAAGCHAVMGQSALPMDFPDYVLVDFKSGEIDADVMRDMPAKGGSAWERAQATPAHLRQLEALYRTQHVPLSARISVRCQLASADEALVGLDVVQLGDSCLEFSSSDFWSWRAMRTETLQLLTQRLVNVEPRSLSTHSLGVLAYAMKFAECLSSGRLDEFDNYDNDEPTSIDRGALFLEELDLCDGHVPEFMPTIDHHCLWRELQVDELSTPPSIYWPGLGR